ncbi:IPT/TIG domain-containing protein [Deinococcus pimensis]|uniref:IPT/TIG domain-containing protein n=1 Tax=Deinococcus pimensis TaxID=309888 RepID=UPI00047F9FAB|nr:IPT/TIG domain-containing protein [Deinococcus pimensis]
MHPRRHTPTLTLVLTAALLSACGHSDPPPPPTPPAPDATLDADTLNPAARGEPITLHGAHLATGDHVKVGDADATNVTWTDTDVTFTVPDTAAWGDNQVTLTVNGKTLTVPTPLFVGAKLNPAASTTNDIQTALDALPDHAALILGAREYTSAGATLVIDNKTLHGAGPDQTRVNGNVRFVVNGDAHVEMKRLTFVGDQFDVTASRTDVSHASTQSPLGAARTSNPAAAAGGTSRALLTSPSAADATIHTQSVTTRAPSSLSFDHVALIGSTSTTGSFRSNVISTDLTFTHSRADLHQNAELTATNLTVEDSDLNVLEQNPAAQWGATLDIATLGKIRINRSTLTSNGRMNVRTSLDDVEVHGGKLTVDAFGLCSAWCSNGLQISSTLGDVDITGSSVNVSAPSRGAAFTSSLGITSAAGNLNIQDNTLIHADDTLDLTAGTTYNNAIPVNHVTLTGNKEVSAGDGPDGVNLGTLNIYNNHLGTVTVQNNTTLKSDYRMDVHSGSGQVVVKDNPHIEVISGDSSKLDTPSQGILWLYTDVAGNHTPGRLDVSNNTFKLDGKLYAETARDDFAWSKNTVDVTGNNSPRVEARCNHANTCVLTDNTITIRDTHPTLDTRTFASFKLMADTFASSDAPQTVTVTGNTIVTLGGRTSTTAMSLGWGAATVKDNTLTSSGTAAFTAVQATATVTANTLHLFSGGGPTGDDQGLSLSAVQGATGHLSVLNFTGNTVSNAGLTSAFDEDGMGTLDSLTVQDNVGVRLP